MFFDVQHMRLYLHWFEDISMPPVGCFTSRHTTLVQDREWGGDEDGSNEKKKEEKNIICNGRSTVTSHPQK